MKDSRSPIEVQKNTDGIEKQAMIDIVTLLLFMLQWLASFKNKANDMVIKSMERNRTER